MILPRLLVLTDRTQCAGSLVDAVAGAVGSGARAVVLREKDLAEEDRDRLVAELRLILAPVGGLLIRAGGGPGRGADGVHLAAADAFPAARPALVGRSCHSAQELGRAREEGCDYAMISPVFPTASKPGYGPALGLAGLASAVTAGPPAYALGGVRPDDVEGCLAAGAHGVAVMGAIMREPALAGAYLSELEGARA